MRILLILLMCVSFAYGQNDTTKYFISKDYGWLWNRGKFKMLVLPTDTTSNKLGVAQLSNGLYYGNGSKWQSVGGGSSTNDTAYAKLNYDNNYSGLNSFEDGNFKLKGLGGGGVRFHYLDAGVSQEHLYFPYSYSDSVAYLSTVRTLIDGSTPTVSGLGGIDSIRLVNTGVIFTTPAAFSKVATTGVITQTLATQTANKVLASPNGSSGTPTFRSLVNADLPKRIDSIEKALPSGLITFTGTTAPSGTNNSTYEWSQNGRVVTFRLNLSYSVAATAITGVVIAIPTDMPTPILVTDPLTANVNDVMIPLSCNGGNTRTIINPLSANINRNGGTPAIRMACASQNIQYLQIAGSYFTNN